MSIDGIKHFLLHYCSGNSSRLGCLVQPQYLFTVTVSPGQSPLHQAWPNAASFPTSNFVVVGHFTYDLWDCSLQVIWITPVIYHILVTIYYSISFVKSTDFISNNSVLDENQKNSKDAAIPKNSHDHIYSATALSQPLHDLFPTLMKKKSRDMDLQYLHDSFDSSHTKLNLLSSVLPRAHREPTHNYKHKVLHSISFHHRQEKID